jgi:hypothetical protein
MLQAADAQYSCLVHLAFVPRAQRALPPQTLGATRCLSRRRHWSELTIASPGQHRAAGLEHMLAGIRSV